MLVNFTDRHHPCPVFECTSSATSKSQLLEHVHQHHGGDPANAPANGDASLGSKGIGDLTVRRVLLGVGCHLDSNLGLVVCTSHGIALDGSNLKSHLAQHDLALSDSDLSVLRKAKGLVDHKQFFSTLKAPHPPVKGVCVDFKGYYCLEQGCLDAFQSKDLLDVHVAFVHQNNNPSKLYGRGPLQAVFGIDHKCTRVVVELSEEEIRARVASAVASMPPLVHAGTNDSRSVSRDLILKMMRWEYYLEEFSSVPVGDLSDLGHCKVHELNEMDFWFYSKLVGDVKIWLQTLGRASPLVHEHLKR